MFDEIALDAIMTGKKDGAAGHAKESCSKKPCTGERLGQRDRQQ
jgi:hypothetical protein